MKAYTEEDLVKSLTEMELVTTDQVDDLVDQAQAKKITLEEILVEQNILNDNDLGKLVSDLMGISYVDLTQLVIEDYTLNIIPEVVAKKYNAIAFKEDEEGLHVASSFPQNLAIRKLLEKKVGIPVVVYYATQAGINESLTLYSKDVKKAFDSLLRESVEKAQKGKAPEPSIVKIVDLIISYADKNKASDIHIEPQDENSVIRFRIDGVLHDVFNLPYDLHAQVVTRIKVLSKLRTDEHSSAQDGKIEYKKNGESLDIRVSIVPISDGEKVVMRLLSERSRQFSLTDLGLRDDDLKRVKDAYSKPHGMILATGPTGCGKTTTLYTILKNLNKRDINIMTIEDPVEYDIEGVNQIQVNEKTGLTFASGLRSVVRQDPDIVLVGEIRDEETADISVNAAMTGHLVLSTLHTNDAATSIPRLLDLSVEPFLVSSTINVIIAQRLVRNICHKCRFSRELGQSDLPNLSSKISPELFTKYFEGKNVRVYEGKGCEVCHHTGYRGRVGIYEVLVVNDSLREAIVARKDASVIRDLAIKSGMRTMFEDGVSKVLEGVTTIEEILRVTKD